MAVPQQIEVLDLRHFSARQLRPLLEQEAQVWQHRLEWDYTHSTRLLLEYLDSKILPGFVALLRGRICGYTFCVYEGQKAVIGDIYADAENPAPLAIVHTLTRHLLETLGASPGLERIEAQLLLFDSGTLAPAFAAACGTGRALGVYPRFFLERALHRASTPVATTSYPPEIELCPWSTLFYMPAAELIRTAYLGHVDSDINDQYRTLAGSLRFLHNIIRFPGCGTFDPESSWVLRDRRTDALVAVLLCSRVAPQVAHLTQLCVAASWRGHRLGSLLLDECLSRLPLAGYALLTLTVTERNTSALALYRRAGFTIRQRFDALVIDRHPDAARPAPTL